MLRVIHFVHELEPGGIELWLRWISPYLIANGVQLEIGVASPNMGSLAESFRDAGVRLHAFPRLSRVREFNEKLRSLLNTPIEIAHSHCNPTALPLWSARRLGIPIRIAHVHYNGPELGSLSRWLRGPARFLSSRLLRFSATHGLAVSNATADTRFGATWHSFAHWSILYCGIDLERFDQLASIEEARKQLGLSIGGKIIGVVARLAPVKNLVWFMDIFAKLHVQNPQVRLVIVGEGPEQRSLIKRASELGVTDAVHLVGHQANVVPWLASMDCFVLPSLREGLPLSVLEAQAAGLPCVTSAAIPEEACIVPGLLIRMPQESRASDWVDQLSKLLDMSRRSQAECLQICRESPFDLGKSAANLLAYYRKCLRCQGKPEK